MDEKLDMNAVIGAHDVVLLTLDTLRFDVADAQFRAGALPNFEAVCPRGWERRHTPGSFTYAAHHAFFAGFLPTPAKPGPHPRLFASQFEGSETTVSDTFVFAEPTLPEALRARGYATLCAGGVGFFNRRTALGRVLPDMFEHAEWRHEFGVTNHDSTHAQLTWVAEHLAEEPRRAFVFVNISAIHQPNCHYVDGATDDLTSHAAALRYVDAQLPTLWGALRTRGDAFVILCSDHGTAYGEDGFHGHRLAHSTVWDVPYAHFWIRA